MKAEEIMAEEQQKILVVDDERLNINVLVDLLKPNYKMMAAKSGEQALKAVQIANPPDLILLDIMMPEMDGYEVCRRLKADEATRDIPVIFVTAMGETKDETKGLELGAVDYLTKPISPPIVEARVKTHLALRRNMAELQKAYGVIEAQKDRMEEELNVGRDIQMSMVPQKFPAFPDRNEFSIHAALHPAREVGGDFYDFFFIDENRLCLCVGDVSGKGVPAALFMAVTRTLIKARATDDRSTASILTRINDEISRDNKAYMFVTLFVGILDTITGELVYTNAGHNPTYIRKADGNLERLDTLHGPVVGAREGLAYKEDRIRLSKGDTVLMYTDGVTEARNQNKEFFEEQRLKDLLSGHEFDSAEALVIKTVSAVKRFEDGAEQFDDITVLALQCLKQPESVEIPILDMTLKNQLTEIDRFKESFNAFSEENGIPTTVRRELNVVFDDLLNNVVSYAYQDDEEHEIEVRIEVGGERIVVSIADDGIPFNPFDAETPDTNLALEERAIGGLGIHLVLNVMDKVAYQRRTDKNVLTMVKKLTENK
jgi:sigma-B regulation protein RsbU (phosphoserine phosphatase)